MSDFAAWLLTMALVYFGWQIGGGLRAIAASITAATEGRGT